MDIPSETESVDSSAEDPNSSLANGEWWRTNEFKLHLPFFGERLNDLLRDWCEELQGVFEMQLGGTADEDLTQAVRTDTVTATRSSVRLAVLQEASGLVFDFILYAGVLLALALGILAVSRGPNWLDGIVVCAAVVFLAGLSLPETSKLSVKLDPAFSVSLVVLPVAVLALALRPVSGLGYLEAFAAVLVAVSALVGILFLVGFAIDHATPVSSAVVVLGVLATSSVAVGTYVETGTWPMWVRLSFNAIALAGLGSAVGLAFVHFVSAALWKFHEARKLLRVPEAEVVQSTLLTIGGIQPAPKATAATQGFELRSDVVYSESGRSAIVLDLEYLATVIERDVAKALSREDPSSSDAISSEMAERAESLRVHKRAILLGRPGSVEPLLDALRSLVLLGAARDWFDMPRVDVVRGAKESRTVRVRRLLGRILSLAVPLAFGIVALWVNQPELVPIAAVWAAVALGEIAKPGAGEDIVKSASEAEKLSKGFVSALFPGDRR